MVGTSAHRTPGPAPPQERAVVGCLQQPQRRVWAPVLGHHRCRHGASATWRRVTSVTSTSPSPRPAGEHRGRVDDLVGRRSSPGCCRWRQAACRGDASCRRRHGPCWPGVARPDPCAPRRGRSTAAWRSCPSSGRLRPEPLFSARNRSVSAAAARASTRCDSSTASSTSWAWVSLRHRPQS